MTIETRRRTRRGTAWSWSAAASAGLNATRELADADVDLTLVDRTNHHLFQPLLYQVADRHPLARADRAGAARHPQGPAQRPRAARRGLRPRPGRARSSARTARTAATVELPYDSLVVAAGATHSYFGKDEFAEFAPGMKTIEDARYIRDTILAKFEMAEMATDPAERAEWLTFVVIGAGPTGVELAGQIAELAHTVLPQDYRSVNTREARIVLLEGAPAVLPPFDKKLQAYTHEQLEKMGVEVHLNSLAVAMDHESITFKGPDGVHDIRARTRIWAAGVAASPLAKMLAEKAGVETDRAGRILVSPDCTVPGHPEVFAIGDMVSLNKLPGVAQPALQEGSYVGNVIKERLAGDTDGKPFHYFDKGSMATIGYRAAVADAFHVKVTGLIAYIMWAAVHVWYLIGWGNRILTIYQWARNLVFTKNRNHRIITFYRSKQDLSRAAHSGRLPRDPAGVDPPGRQGHRPLAPRGGGAPRSSPFRGGRGGPAASA